MVSNQKVDEIERKLNDNMWLGGQQPSKDDADAFSSLNGSPDADAYPNAAAWYSLVGKFTDAVRGTWTAGSAGSDAPQQKGGAKGKGGKKEESKAAAPAKGKEQKGKDQKGKSGGAAKAEAKPAEEEKKGEAEDQPRLLHLKQIETQMQELMNNERIYELDAQEGYE